MEQQQPGNKKEKQTATLDYGKAGAIAEEMLSAIHTVTSYGGQAEFVERYTYKFTTRAKDTYQKVGGSL